MQKSDEATKRRSDEGKVGGAALSPSPGTPGEGRGEGLLATGNWQLATLLPALLLAALCLAAAPATQPAAEAASQNFLQLLLRGGMFMIPIGIASLFGVALILERALALRRSRIVPKHFMDDLKAAGNDRKEALAYCRANPSPIARIMAAGLRKLHQGPAATEKGIEDAGDNELHKLRRNMRMLYGVAAVAPMMGLLGTVWGMIEAFRVASAHKGLGRPELLATGIYEALVTTLAGLMVAIPVLMFYYYFSGKIEQVVADMNDASAEFVEHFVEEERGEITSAATAVNPT